MTNYQKYINTLRKCAKEHENDRTFTGHIIVSDLCKDTANLLEELKQEPILNKIRAEIEQTTSRYCISRERGGSGQVEWSDRLIKESEVLEIIDKYKTESE